MQAKAVVQSLSPPRDTRFRRRMICVRHWLKRAFLVNHNHRLSTLGEEISGCSYTFVADGLGPESVVYSGGVGKDVSFEHALVREFGCSVVLFDPSPIGLATMELQENQIPQFRFFPVGLAGHSGTLRLAPPFTPEGDSWYVSDGLAGTSEVRCVDLASLMKQNGHERVDLLKIDIEGAEYGVIDQIIEKRIPVRQILVEFHDGILPGVRLRQSLRATFKLLTRGYKMVWEMGNLNTFFWGRAWASGKGTVGGIVHA